MNSISPYAPRIDQLTRAVAVHTMVFFVLRLSCIFS